MAQDTTNNWCDRAWNDRRRTSLLLVEWLRIDMAGIKSFLHYWDHLTGIVLAQWMVKMDLRPIMIPARYRK